MNGIRRALRGLPPGPVRDSEATGVTLFELIVVVVVTAILAILLVISTNFLVVRTKVSRVKEEQRVLVRALQNYQMDYSNLPGEATGLDALVAPTAYLASVPKDPFLRTSHEATYYYFSPDGWGHTYAIVSAGPDGKLDVLPFLNHSRIMGARYPGGDTFMSSNPAGQPNDTGLEGDGLGGLTGYWFSDFLIRYTYDPTNGTVSAGDIVTMVVNY